MGIKGIFQEGMKESRRRKALRKEKKGLKQKEKVHGEQLTALGQKAWETKVTVDRDLRESLAQIQKQLDELNARIEELQKQKQEAEEKKKLENERFDTSRRDVEEKKKGVDQRLNDGKNILNAAQREAEQASNRLSVIPKEREQWNKKAMDAATPETEKGEIQKKLSGLADEEKAVQSKYQEKTEAAKKQSEKIAPIQAEADQLQKLLDEIRADQKKVTEELNKTITGITRELEDNTKKSQEIEKTQKTNFRALGEKLSAAGAGDPAVAAEMAVVKATEKEMADNQMHINDLEGQKNDAQSGAYKKMVWIIAGGVVLVAAIVIALVIIL